MQETNIPSLETFGYRFEHSANSRLDAADKCTNMLILVTWSRCTRLPGLSGSSCAASGVQHHSACVVVINFHVSIYKGLESSKCLLGMSQVGLSQVASLQRHRGTCATSTLQLPCKHRLYKHLPTR